MIRVINAWAQNFEELANPQLYGERLGDGMLTPTACTVTEEAGGKYSLQMTHPVDDAGKWKAITPMSMILAPIPPTTIPAIDSEGSAIGVGNEVWIVSGDYANLYASWTYVYPAWRSGQGYYPGNRVNHNGYVWDCIKITLAEPTVGSDAWKRFSPVRPVLKQLPEDTILIVSSQDSTWLHVTLMNGDSGWVMKNAATYQYTIDEDSEIIKHLEERTLTHQLFRVTDITLDGKAMTVKVTAQHVSYDWSISIVGRITLKDTPLSTAIAAIRSAVLPDGASSAPNIYAATSSATITSACTRKTLTSVILDPEDGLVSQARARLIRDNLDYFLLDDSETDRGYTIRYGVNLQGVTWRRDYTKLVTRVMPIAKDANGDDFYLPETYVDSPHRGDYPVDGYQALQVQAKIGTDGTEEEVKIKMTQEAGKVFSEKKADLPVTTLNVDFLMLGDTEEFSQYRDMERLNLYDTIEIIHPDLGLNTRAQVSSYEWDALRLHYNKITVGDVFEPAARTVYGYNVADRAIGIRKLTPEAIDEIRNGS